MTKEVMYDFLLENVCSADFLSGAIAIGGYNSDTLEYVLFYHTGYRNFFQYQEEIMVA